MPFCLASINQRHNGKKFTSNKIAANNILSNQHEARLKQNEQTSSRGQEFSRLMKGLALSGMYLQNTN